MKLTTLASTIGAGVLVLGILGLISGEQRLAGGMNTDILLDMTRLALGAFLVYGGMKSTDIARTAFKVFGVAYIGMFVLGLVSPDLFGLLPHGLGWIDQTLHIVGGVASLFFAANAHKNKVAY